MHWYGIDCMKKFGAFSIRKEGAKCVVDTAAAASTAAAAEID